MVLCKIFRHKRCDQDRSWRRELVFPLQYLVGTSTIAVENHGLGSRFIGDGAVIGHALLKKQTQGLTYPIIHVQETDFDPIMSIGRIH